MTDVNMIVHASDSGGTPLLTNPWVKGSPGATNRITFSNDLSNATVWAATNMAVSKSAVGLRNRPADACILTANNNYATVVRVAPVTTPSGSHVARWWLKRLAGVGAVEITFNGSNWLPITGIDGLSFNPFMATYGPATSILIGIRFAASGDEIIVANSELFTNLSVAQSISDLPPIICDGDSEISIGASLMSFSVANHGSSGCYVFEYRPPLDSSIMSAGDVQILSLAGAADLCYYDSVSKQFEAKDSDNNIALKAQAMTGGASYVVGIAYGDGKMRLCVDGTWGAEVTYSGTFPSGSALELLKSATYTGKVRRLRRWDGNYVAAVQRVTAEMPPANIPPVADAGGPYAVGQDQPVQFDGSGSYDSDGVIVSYVWDFGDGYFGSGVAPEHTYVGTGPFDVSLTVTDEDDASDVAYTTVTIDSSQYPWVEDIDDPDPEYLVPVDRGREVNFSLVSFGTAKQFPSGNIVSSYSYISGKNFTAVTDLVNDARALNPNLKWYMRICTQEYQGDSDPYANFSSGPQFRGTGPVTDGMNVFAGHWAYQRHERLTVDMNATTLDVYVASAAGINLSHNPYACIYSPGWADAEHVLIQSIDTSSTPNRIRLVSRGYKSTAQPHTVANLSRIAIHQEGNVNNSTFWMRNCSTICPVDGNGKRWIDFLSDWVVAHFMRNPTDTGPIAATPDGIEDDSDFDVVQMGSGGADINRALTVDNGTTPDFGFSRDGNMVNYWGLGYDEYYTMLSSKLWAAGYTWAAVTAGDGKILGRVGTIGTQIEGGPDNTYGGAPNYNRLQHYEGAAKFAIAHPYGPMISDVQNRTPSLTYGGDTDNSAIRFAMCWSWIFGHYHSNQNNTPYADRWFEEYSVYPSGVCVPVSSYADRRTYRGWMGPPTTKGYRYLENPSAWDWANNNFANGDLGAPITGWSFSNCAQEFSTAHVARGTRSLKLSPGPQYTGSLPNIAASSASTPSLAFAASQYHTACVSLFAESDRWVQLNVAGYSEFVYPLHVGWNRMVYTIRTGTSQVNGPIRLDLGWGRSPVWLDQIYVKNNARANVFMREFSNALVIINAGVTSATVTLPFTCDRLQGYQDTGAPMNTGVTGITQITVPAKDGVVLKRAA